MDKYVLTGGPGSGKSALIGVLQKQGYNVIEEGARSVLKERKKFPLTKEEHQIRQKIIFGRQLEKELSYQDGFGKVFLDRGLIDCFAYLRHFTGELNGLALPKLGFVDYKKVFSLDMVKFEKDGLRTEKNEAEALQIHKMVLSEYRERGYELVNVPKFSNDKDTSIKERINFILKNL